MCAESNGLPVTRHEFPLLRAVHFVVHGNLGTGASNNGRLDALGKSVAEYVRARHVDVPRHLVPVANLPPHPRNASDAGGALTPPRSDASEGLRQRPTPPAF